MRIPKPNRGFTFLHRPSLCLSLLDCVLMYFLSARLCIMIGNDVLALQVPYLSTNAEYSQAECQSMPSMTEVSLIDRANHLHVHSLSVRILYYLL